MDASRRQAPRSPSRAALWAFGLAGVAASGLTVALAASTDELYQRPLRVLLITWITLPFIFGGLLAWRRRPDSRFGPLMIVAGFASSLSTLSWSELPPLNTVGQLCDLLVVAVWLHVFLAYPSGLLAGRLEQVLVGTSYLAALGMQLVVLMLGGFDTRHLLSVVPAPDLAEAVQNVQLVLLSALCVAGAVVVLLRRRRLGPMQRRRPTQLLIDSFGLCLVMVAVLLLAGAFQLPGFEVLRLATFAVAGLAPVAFLAGLLDARLARAGVGELLVHLRSDASPQLRDLIARALRDPTLTLAYWLPPYGSWADEAGLPVSLPDPGGDRAVTVIERDGEPVAALLYDPALRDEPELVDAVSAAAAIALENGRLEAELRARLQDLQGSRTRVIEAAQRERERLERDLHDGAQQRLVALALELGMLSEGLDDTDTRVRLDRARAEVSVSLEELRDLARGIHPAVVSGHGLTVALESLAARAITPMQLTVRDIPRLPERVEVAAYFVVSEGLANAAKHAQATRVTVDVQIVGGVLVAEVTDDGIGGADTERGTGLRGLADRVEALEGRLRVWTPMGGGTRIRAEIPCG